LNDDGARLTGIVNHDGKRLSISIQTVQGGVVALSGIHGHVQCTYNARIAAVPTVGRGDRTKNQEVTENAHNRIRKANKTTPKTKVRVNLVNCAKAYRQHAAAGAYPVTVGNKYLMWLRVV
jgi:hypothetical protein